MKRKVCIAFNVFATFNTIPNVDKTNNKFHIDRNQITIPQDSHEIDHFKPFILNKMLQDMKSLKGKEVKFANEMKTTTIQKEVDHEDKTPLSMKANHNTQRYEIKSNKSIHFEKENSIA